MVEDKMNKMRESLRLMSLSRFSYTISIFLLQAIFASIAGIVFSVGFYGDSNMFPDNP